jgi:hypothetical protein
MQELATQYYVQAAATSTARPRTARVSLPLHWRTKCAGSLAAALGAADGVEKGHAGQVHHHADGRADAGASCHMKPAISAMAFGLLLGVLVGLAASPTVGALVTGLVGVVVTLRGRPSGQADGTPDLALLAAFSFACLLGIAGGVLTRTHSWLSPTLKSQLLTGA